MFASPFFFLIFLSRSVIKLQKSQVQPGLQGKKNFSKFYFLKVSFFFYKKEGGNPITQKQLILIKDQFGNLTYASSRILPFLKIFIILNNKGMIKILKYRIINKEFLLSNLNTSSICHPKGRRNKST